MPLLELKNLFKAYGPVRAVDGVSLFLNEGEIYGLLGPNGAGKTTTISMIAGLLKPDGGDIHIAGSNFWHDPQAAKKIMGFVPQEVTLYEELSARENLMFWGQLAGLSSKQAKQRTEELLSALSLVDRAKDPVKNYSGGMKRRLNVGCALLHRPRLLLLDEPTVGIDPQARMNLLEFVRQLCKEGTSILYTTHYLEEAETLCQRIGIIDHGRLLAEGTLADLQARLGGAQLFVLEGNLGQVDPDQCPGFSQKFRVMQRSARQLLVASLGERDPSECLKNLLSYGMPLENVTLKRPSLNEVFLQLTGRELRE